MLDSIFMKVLDMSKTGAIVIIAVIIARLLLKRAPKVISYALWAVVLLRLLCPVSFESRVSALPQMTPVSQNYSLADESVSVIGASEAAYKAVSGVLSGSNAEVQNIRTTEKDETGSNVYVKTDAADVFILFGQYVWLAGVAAMALWSGVSYLKLRRKTRVCLSHDKNIFIADDIRSPFVMGIARPKIYVPCGLDEKELEYIILHEEHHIKRLDHIIKILAFAALAIHWFNPLVWLAFILAGRDMEMSCDEAVIQKLGSEVRADYSSTLLTLATGRQIIAGTPLSFGEGDPKGRIKNLSKWKKPAVWAVLLAGTVGIVLAVCLLTDPKSGDNLNENAFYLVIGEDNVHSIEISEPNSSGGIVNADGSDFKKGDTVWLDLESDGSLHLLRGLMITALDVEGNPVHTITIPNDATESEIANIVLGDGWLHGPIDAAVQTTAPDEQSPAPGNDSDAAAVQIVSIDDPTKNSSFSYDSAMEKFFEDDSFEYYFGGIYKEHVTVHYSDGTKENIQTALEKGRISIKDLDIFGISYHAEPKSNSLDAALSKAIMEHYSEPMPDGLIRAESHIVLAEETVNGTPLEGSDYHVQYTTVYMLVYFVKFSAYEGELNPVGGSYVPVAVTFTQTENSEYTLEEFWQPRDGSYYADDIRAKFPADAAQAALNDQEYVAELKAQAYSKALAYLDSIGSLDERIAKILDEMISSPAWSSNPEDYINEHEDEYNELVSFGEYTLRYCFTEFLSEDRTDLRGHIMARVCSDICLSLGEVLIIDGPEPVNGQQWFNAFLSAANTLKDQYSYEDLMKHYPASFLLLRLSDESFASKF